LNNNKTAAATVTITARPALTIVAAAAVMTAAATAVALLAILNHLKVSTRFELGRKIWYRISELQNRFEGNLDDSYNSCTKALMRVSRE